MNRLSHLSHDVLLNCILKSQGSIPLGHRTKAGSFGMTLADTIINWARSSEIGVTARWSVNIFIKDCQQSFRMALAGHSEASFTVVGSVIYSAIGDKTGPYFSLPEAHYVSIFTTGRTIIPSPHAFIQKSLLIIWREPKPASQFVSSTEI